MFYVIVSKLFMLFSRLTLKQKWCSDRTRGKKKKKRKSSCFSFTSSKVACYFLSLYFYFLTNLEVVMKLSNMRCRMILYSPTFLKEKKTEANQSSLRKNWEDPFHPKSRNKCLGWCRLGLNSGFAIYKLCDLDSVKPHWASVFLYLRWEEDNIFNSIRLS